MTQYSSVCEVCGGPKGQSAARRCAACYHRARKDGPHKVVEAPCRLCGVPVQLEGKLGLERARRGSAYCSEEHREQWLHARWHEVGQAGGRSHAAESSQRMRTHNPMRDPKVRAVVATKTRVRGWPANVPKGGNGRPLPAPQLLLAATLGWETEVAVCTGDLGSIFDAPHAYKVDIGNMELRAAIEVDGASHDSPERRIQDIKKETVLRGLGWAVLRFSNKQVMEHLGECVQTVLSTMSK